MIEMTDLEIIHTIEKTLDVSLKQLHMIGGFEKGYTINDQEQVDGVGLYRCNISELNQVLPLLQQLPALEHLNLSANQISDISALSTLPRLFELYLNHNNITDADSLASLPQLKMLYLADNQIRDIHCLSELTQLKTLQLSHNKIDDISALEHLDKLKMADLSGNRIEILPSWITKFNAAIYRKHVCEKGNISLFENPIKQPPVEIIEEGNEAMINYFAQLSSQGTALIHEAKLMLVGEPGSGKTTLMNKLFDHNYPVPNVNQASTVGIEVRQNWVFHNADREKFKAHIWDFGGQQIQYMLHQFFLTSDCVYVLMAEKRRELTNFDYWLNVIHLLGKNAPVVILFNEINFESVNSFVYDEKKYKNLFDGLDLQKLDVNFANLDDGRFQVLLNTIKGKLSNLDHMGKEVPSRWVDIRQALEELESRKHIRISEYFDICSQHGIDKLP
ncbi:MAG: internalin A, partial [Phenylobacterium sp.]